MTNKNLFMDTTTYIALSGQVASANKQSVLTNNTANAATPGFKAESVLFQKWLYQDSDRKSTMPVDAKTVTDHTQGNIQKTNSKFDFAIVGTGFFGLREADGRLRFTRNGRFTLSSNGVVRDIHGRPLVTMDGEEIVFAEDESAFTVNRDGTIYINNEERGALGVFQLPEENSAIKTQYGDFIIDGEPVPADMSQATIVQGMLEASNADAIMGLVDLTEITRQVDRNNLVMNANRDNVRTTYKVFHNN